MKKLMGTGLLFAGAGVVFVLLPVHVAMTGVVLLLLGGAMLLGGFLMNKPTHRRVNCFSALTVLASVGVICLMAAMNIITTSGHSDWERAGQSEYGIVLGAAVHESGRPSRIMGSRLDAAQLFLEENPDARLILSGGQGDDEPMSEAQCMYDILTARGIDPHRLIMEDESHTTRENLINSMAIIREQGGTEKTITLITSEFHQRRAAFIADSLGIDTCPVSGITDQWFYRVNYTLREVFAFVKAYIQS